ncbi:MAG: hypothetical protein K2J15_06560 [Muribaculaceae bacterium]|nr:hypothetical protein [Muribaculaceae bacterium]
MKMTKTINNKLPDVPSDLATPDPKPVKGLTISEIRYQRALVALQREFCKEKVNGGVKKLTHFNPLGSKSKTSNSFGSKAGAIAQKLIGGMNYFDYAIIGFTAFSNVRKLFKIFKKK